MLNPAEEDTECVQNEEGGLCLASSSLEIDGEIEDHRAHVKVK